MIKDVEEITEVRLPCFQCPYGHSCKYYQNIAWDQWIVEHQDMGCPALLYPYDSIYISLMMANEERKRQKERAESGKIGWF